MLRNERQLGSELGLEAERVTSKGHLLPDAIVIELVAAWLRNCDGQFVLDGFPRSLGQAEALEQMLATKGTPLDVVLALEADFATLEARVMNRLTCQRCGAIVSLGLHVNSDSDPCPKCAGVLGKRPDDSLETLAARMVEYHEKTEPLFEFYAKRNLLRRVDSTLSPEVVFGNVSRILEEE